MSCPGNLLFVSPQLPRRQGSPLAIRAYNTLTELLSSHRGFLLVTEACETEAALDPDLAAQLAGYEIYRPHQVEHPFIPREIASLHPWLEKMRGNRQAKTRAKLEARAADQGACAFPGTTFERMHALGLAASMAVRARLELPSTRARQPWISLDLEPEQMQLAPPTDRAETKATEADASGTKPFGEFHELWVDTRSKLRRVRHLEYTGQILVVPVRIPVVAHPSPQRPHSGVFRWLTVRSSATNADVQELESLYRVLQPKLRANQGRGGQLHVIDLDCRDRIARAFAVSPELKLHQPPTSVDAAYRAADACLVTPPAHSGGVLRVLEAFAHQRPVIALRQATIGLGVEHGRELLIADDFHELAELACQLTAEPALQARLAAAGRNYQVRFHLAEGTRIHRELPQPAAGRSTVDV